MSRFICILFAPLALLLSACSPYVDDFHYSPHPALADIPATQPQDGPPVSVVASIVGVHRENDKQDIPESVEVALQVQNNGPAPLTFDPMSMKLTNGMITFRAPTVRPPTPVTLAPGETASVDTFFPFPTDLSWDNTDMHWLQLSWLVQLDGRNVRQVVNFQRYFPRYYYYEPYPYRYYDSPHFWIGGAVIVHRR